MNIFTSVNTPHDPINSVGIIRNEFDNIITKEAYEQANIYNNLYNQFKKIITNKQNCYINISTDRAISSTTLSSINELFMYKNGKIYESDLKIIYIDSICDLDINNYDDEMTNKSYRKSVVSNLLTISNDEDITRSYTQHALPLQLSQFIFMGMQDISSHEENMLLNGNSSYYKLERLNKNLDKILDSIVNKCGSSPVAIVFDMSVFNFQLAPCIIRDNTDDKTKGLNLDQFNLILQKLSTIKNIKLIDITGHYLALSDTTPAYRVTIETITTIYSRLLNLKEYKLNIYNENTRFLIYKPVEELENNDEYGWYILRNIPNEYKNDLLKEIDHENIMFINIDGDDDVEIMVTSTTMMEQNEKCYYTATSYKDCTLYPYEKMDMCFELIN